jgi:hypothetical protein
MIKPRNMRWAGYVASMGRSGVSTEFWLRKPEGKTPIGRPAWKWEDYREIR